MKTKTIASTLFVLMATLTIAACSGADSKSSDKKGGARSPGGKPPAAAFEACASKSEGQSCSVTSSRGEMSGSCKAPPQGAATLACVPARKRK